MVTVNGAVYMICDMYTITITANNNTTNLAIIDLLGLNKGYNLTYTIT